MMIKPDNNIELSIVMPCLNEAETVATCIRKAMSFMETNSINGEIIIADNGSTDNSRDIASSIGAKVVTVSDKGYGSALIGGITASQGKYIIMGDADDSYDFLNLKEYVEKLREGNDLVMGNRFKGKKIPGAMPFLHRYLGNPVLSGIGRLFFKSKIGDFHCGLRGFSKEAFTKMSLRTSGMEFASEMVVKATLLGMKISEVETTLYPDGRSGKPHLRSFRDGWRHLRFLLLYSPRWLFLYPGLSLMILGFVLGGMIFLKTDLTWDIHTMLYAVAGIMIGFQSVIFALFSKTFAVHDKLLPSNTTIDRILNKITLEKGLLIGSILILLGIAGSVYLFVIWETGIFFRLGITITMRIVIASFTVLVLGCQTIFSSFFFNFLKMNTKDS